jgi:pSer/pThr/pTyr-binding forkhead associated (FHA) protein
MTSDLTLELMIMSGPDDGQVHTLRGNFIHDDHLNVWRCRFGLGRRDTSDVCIPFDTLVSRLHATIQISPDGEIWLTDEDSRNGTFIGREKLAMPHALEVGEMFRIGKTWIRVQSLHLNQEV